MSTVTDIRDHRRRQLKGNAIQDVIDLMVAHQVTISDIEKYLTDGKNRNTAQGLSRHRAKQERRDIATNAVNTRWSNYRKLTQDVKDRKAKRQELVDSIEIEPLGSLTETESVELSVDALSGLLGGDV